MSDIRLVLVHMMNEMYGENNRIAINFYMDCLNENLSDDLLESIVKYHKILSK